MGAVPVSGRLTEAIAVTVLVSPRPRLGPVVAGETKRPEVFPVVPALVAVVASQAAPEDEAEVPAAVPVAVEVPYATPAPDRHPQVATTTDARLGAALPVAAMTVVGRVVPVVAMAVNALEGATYAVAPVAVFHVADTRDRVGLPRPLLGGLRAWARVRAPDVRPHPLDVARTLGLVVPRVDLLRLLAPVAAPYAVEDVPI